MLIPMQILHDRHDVQPVGVVHLGAHLGEEAPDYAQAGIKRVFWVEANPALMAGLYANITAFDGQRAVQAVITDQDDKEVTFRPASFSMSSSILPMTGHLTHYPWIHEIGTETYQSITIDTLLKREQEDASQYDMLNVDLEGAELMAMRGATNLLPHMKYVYSEVYFEDMYAGGALIDELDAYLATFGFTRTLTEKAYLDGLFKGFGDALYTK